MNQSKDIRLLASETAIHWLRDPGDYTYLRESVAHFSPLNCSHHKRAAFKGCELVGYSYVDLAKQSHLDRPAVRIWYLWHERPDGQLDGIAKWIPGDPGNGDPAIVQSIMLYAPSAEPRENPAPSSIAKKRATLVRNEERTFWADFDRQYGHVAPKPGLLKRIFK